MNEKEAAELLRYFEERCKYYYLAGIADASVISDKTKRHDKESPSDSCLIFLMSKKNAADRLCGISERK